MNNFDEIIKTMEDRGLIYKDGETIHLLDKGKLESKALLLSNKEARTFLYGLIIQELLNNNKLKDKEARHKALERMVEDLTKEKILTTDEVIKEFNEVLSELESFLSK